MFFGEYLTKLFEYINDLNVEYNSLSYEKQKELTILGRIKFYNWKFEAVMMLSMGIIYLIYYFGTRINLSKANKLFSDLNKFFLQDLQFAKSGFSSRTKGNINYISEKKNTWFTTFATGRSCIESVTVKVHLLSRFNPFSMIMEYFLSLFFFQFIQHSENEYIEITIKPNGKYATDKVGILYGNKDDILNKFRFIASIVNKTGMNEFRESNYFLSLTHTSENKDLPIEYVFMSESNQLSQFFLHYTKSDFFSLLAQCSPFLHFISFTDLPSKKPLTDKSWEAGQQPRCVIKCSMITSDEQIALLKKLISSMVCIFDTVTKEVVNNNLKIFITNDLLKKSLQFRKEELANINKVMKQVERDIAIEKKQEQEKNKKRDLKLNLKNAEKDKLEMKMKEKRDRRMKNKQRLRM